MEIIKNKSLAEVRPSNSGKTKKAGFTLVELIVTLGLFVIIFTVVIGIFIQAISTSRYVSVITALNNNLSLSLEQFSREVRTAADFCVDVACSSSTFSFRNSSGTLVEYRIGSGLSAGQLMRETGGVANPITATDIEIINLIFVVQVASPSQQPRVTIALTVRPRNPNLQSVITPTQIQTTVSSRDPRQ